MSAFFAAAFVASAVLPAGCGGASPAPRAGADEPPPSAAGADRPVTVSVVGTNDLHGHLSALPVLGGYLRNLREARRQDGGVVVLLDGGDMFQGTLESNLAEGAPVVEAYAALGYDAVTIGNHEFDYGPVGEAATPQEPGDDPRGALLARVRQAGYPFLTANLRSAEDGERVDWPGVPPSTLLDRGPVRIGVIGVTTEDTLRTTLWANVRDLAMAPLAESIAAEAHALRERGADVVLVAAHAGGACTDLSDPHDLSSCRHDEEIFEVARRLPSGAVDAIVAGHTHQAVAHVVEGIPILESYAYGRAFGRIDLSVDPTDGRVVDVRVHPPCELCQQGSVEGGDCASGSYEGRPVEPDPRVAQAIAPALAAAREARERPLGVTVSETITRSRVRESPLGNLFTDLMREAHPGADVALTNGGGLRADLDAGPLTYGELYQAMPFDNRFALVRLSALELAQILADNLARDGSFYSVSGVEAELTCEDDGPVVRLFRPGRRRRPIDPGEVLSVVTTDFLATGGGPFSELSGGQDAIELQGGSPVRDAMAGVLEQRGGALSPGALYDPERPRVRYPSERPVRCEP